MLQTLWFIKFVLLPNINKNIFKKANLIVAKIKYLVVFNPKMIL